MFEGCLDVGVLGLSSVCGIIHWGMGSMLSSTTKPYGGEQQKRALNPFPRATSPGIYAKARALSHTSSPLSLPLSLTLSNLFSVTHPSVAIITAISNSNVSLLPGFSTSLAQNVFSTVCNVVFFTPPESLYFTQIVAHCVLFYRLNKDIKGCF